MAETPLARVGQTEEIAITWRPFELRPEGAPPPPAEYIKQAWERSVSPLAKQLGVKMVRPDLFCRTRLAHEAAEFARRQGKLTDMASALFRAYWHDGRDIGQVDVLCAIGAEAGLDPAELKECLDNRTLADAVVEGLQLAREYEITAVPTFIVGNRYLLQGLVSEEELKRAIALCNGEGLIQLD